VRTPPSPAAAHRPPPPAPVARNPPPPHPTLAAHPATGASPAVAGGVEHHRPEAARAPRHAIYAHPDKSVARSAPPLPRRETQAVRTDTHPVRTPRSEADTGHVSAPAAREAEFDELLAHLTGGGKPAEAAPPQRAPDAALTPPPRRAPDVGLTPPPRRAPDVGLTPPPRRAPDAALTPPPPGAPDPFAPHRGYGPSDQ
jgi:hypothetical protein